MSKNNKHIADSRKLNFSNYHSNTTKRDLNFVDMILNLKSNDADDFKKLSDLFEIFTTMPELKQSENFKESLRNSSHCLNNSRDIKKTLLNMQKNTPDSFLILPLGSEIHMWSTLIKKTDEG